MYKRELEEYEEAMKTYTLNGGGLGVAPITSTATDSGMVSIISSPAQSTEMSMDFPSDPPQPHSPDVGSLMDEDEKDEPIYNNEETTSNISWQPDVSSTE